MTEIEFDNLENKIFQLKKIPSSQRLFKEIFETSFNLLGKFGKGLPSLENHRFYAVKESDDKQKSWFIGYVKPFDESEDSLTLSVRHGEKITTSMKLERTKQCPEYASNSRGFLERLLHKKYLLPNRVFTEDSEGNLYLIHEY